MAGGKGGCFDLVEGDFRCIIMSFVGLAVRERKGVL